MTNGVVHPKVRCNGHASDGSGRPCKAWAVHGRTKCVTHGGASPAPGPSHPAYKHGRYSKSLPTELLGRFKTGLSDPNLLQMSEELALLDTRSGQLLERLATGESAKRWERVREAMRAVLSFQAQGDSDMLEEALDDLAKEVFAKADHEIWHEIRETIESRRRVASTERQRLAAAQQVVTVAEMLSLVSSLSAVVMAHVTDPDARAEISDDVRRLLVREGYSQQREALT